MKGAVDVQGARLTEALSAQVALERLVLRMDESECMKMRNDLGTRKYKPLLHKLAYSDEFGV